MYDRYYMMWYIYTDFAIESIFKCCCLCSVSVSCSMFRICLRCRFYCRCRFRVRVHFRVRNCLCARFRVRWSSKRNRNGNKYEIENGSELGHDIENTIGTTNQNTNDIENEFANESPKGTTEGPRGITYIVSLKHIWEYPDIQIMWCDK